MLPAMAIPLTPVKGKGKCTFRVDMEMPSEISNIESSIPSSNSFDGLRGTLLASAEQALSEDFSVKIKVFDLFILFHPLRLLKNSKRLDLSK